MEHVPEDHMDHIYYLEEFDFDHKRERKGDANNAYAAYNRYMHNHHQQQSSSSNTNSDTSHPLIFQEWYLQWHQERHPDIRYYTDVDTSNSGYMLDQEWIDENGKKRQNFGFAKDANGQCIPT